MVNVQLEFTLWYPRLRSNQIFQLLSVQSIAIVRIISLEYSIA